MLSFAGYSEGGAMNGEVPSVPITTLAGLASLTHFKYSMKLSRYTDGALSDWAHELRLSWVYSDYPSFSSSVLIEDIWQTIHLKNGSNWSNLRLNMRTLHLEGWKTTKCHIITLISQCMFHKIGFNWIKNIDYAQSVSLRLRYYSVSYTHLTLPTIYSE